MVNIYNNLSKVVNKWRYEDWEGNTKKKKDNNSN